jgi:succinoglycan biosynthesis protein ExoW
MTAVAVVIPYFQRRAGILRRAVTSILQQQLAIDTRVEIIVVDDGSPVPARTEIEGLDFALPFQLHLIQQPNGGIAAARNTALRNVTPETTYIALLDSDDIWPDQHLTTALHALDQGYDFYFCNSQRSGRPTSFDQVSFDDFLCRYGREFADGIYDLHTARFLDRMIRARCFTTPSVVYRRAIAPDLIFDTTLRVAGEDCLYFFQLISRATHVCCSTRLLVTLADGVNIHASKASWDDAGHLSRAMSGILACYKFRNTLDVSPKIDRHLRTKIRRLRGLFAYLAVRFFLKTRQLWTEELRGLVRDDKSFYSWYLPLVAYVTICYPLRLYDPLKEIEANNRDSLVMDD